MFKKYWIYYIGIYIVVTYTGCSNDNNSISGLKAKAGYVNDLVVYGRYDGLSRMMSESLKLIISPKLFSTADSGTRSELGEYVKPIDTTSTTINGVTVFVVRSQYQKGVRDVSLQFDDDGKLLHLYTVPKKN